MLNKETMINKLKDLDAELFANGYECKLYIAGGSALLLLDIVQRPTYDVDVFKVNDKKIVKMMNKYDINDEISNVIKGKSYEKYSTLYKVEGNDNLTTYIVIPEYILVLKAFAVISIYRSKEKKSYDVDDASAIMKNIDKKLVLEVLDIICKEEATKMEAKYLREEVVEWIS